MWIVTIAVVVLLIAMISASAYFYSLAIARADKSFLDSNPDLDAGSSDDKVSYDADEVWWRERDFRDWTMEAEDGLKLHAYYLEAKAPSDCTVIIAHGYAGSGLQMSILAKFYWESLGFNVLLPDARGHGRSEGAYIGFGWHERRDYVRWIHKVIGEKGKQQRIVLHGVSMGGATVMMTSGEKLPPQVKAIIADCGYTSVKEQLAYQLKRMYKLPSFPLLHTTSAYAKWRAGYSFGEASALDQVKKSVTPMLFIHGEQDRFVPFSMVHRLYENGPREKELFIVHGAGHALSRQTDPAGYDAAVARFIEKHVR